MAGSVLGQENPRAARPIRGATEAQATCEHRRGTLHRAAPAPCATRGTLHSAAPALCATGAGRCTPQHQSLVPLERDAAQRSTSASCHRRGTLHRAAQAPCATGAGCCTAPRKRLVPPERDAAPRRGSALCHRRGTFHGTDLRRASITRRPGHCGDQAFAARPCGEVWRHSPRWMQCHWDCQHPAQAAETCGMCVGPSRPRGIPSTRNTRTPSARVRLFEASSRVASLVLLTIAAFFWVT